MMTMRRSLVGSLALAAMVLSGCVVTVDVWSPIGTDASATGSWTLNGAVPTISACDAAGVNSVEIQFSNRLDSPVIPAEFVFDCADGGFNLSNVLAAGTYDATYIVRTNTGTVTGATSSFTVGIGDIATFAPFDIVAGTPVFNPKGSDFTMDGMWTINGGAATASACSAAGIANVQLVIQQAGETYTEPGFIFSCAGGGFDTRTLSPQIAFTWGSYMTFWRALDSTGANIGMSSPLGLVVNSPITHSTLATADFVVAPPTASLTLNLSYDTVVGGTMSDTDCAGAGVATIFYTLRDITGGASTIVSESGAAGVACGSQIIFDSAIITGGHTYSVYLEGADAGGVKHWSGMDSTLDVGVGEQAIYNLALTKNS